MNIKPIPPSANPTSVKEVSDDAQRSGAGKNPSAQREKSFSKKPSEPEAVQSAELTPEDADDAMRSSQPVDSQTVIELLAHAPPPSVNKPPRFPSKAYPPTAKKLNRSA
jgi:hypothetical protein